MVWCHRVSDIYVVYCVVSVSSEGRGRRDYSSGSGRHRERRRRALHGAIISKRRLRKSRQICIACASSKPHHRHLLVVSRADVTALATVVKVRAQLLDRVHEHVLQPGIWCAWCDLLKVACRNLHFVW